jgi:hypothetical protein
MKKGFWLVAVSLVVILPLLLACGGGATTPPAETPPAETPPAETPPVETPPVETPPVTSGPPAITHTLEGRADCLLCHSATGIKPFPASHASYTNDLCQSCHQPAS